MSLDLISFKIRLIATLLSNLYIPSKNFPQHRTKNSKKKNSSNRKKHHNKDFYPINRLHSFFFLKKILKSFVVSFDGAGLAHSA